MGPILIKTIVFDWDGTLCDSMAAKVRNAADLFRRHFAFAPDRVADRYLEYSGLPRRDLFARIVADLGRGRELPDDVFDMLSTEFTALNVVGTDGLKIYPDVVPCLDQLRANGLPLYVSSAVPPEELTSGVEQARLWGYFQAVYGSRAGFNKGHGHWSEVCRREDCVMDRMLQVGDDLQDSRLAHLAGARHLRIRRDTLGSDRHGALHTLTDILTRLSRSAESDLLWSLSGEVL